MLPVSNFRYRPRARVHRRVLIALIAILLPGALFAIEDPAPDVLPAVPLEEEGWSPFNLALFAPVQLAGSRRSIYGARFNLLYGNNAHVVGLDLGLVNRARGVAGPLQIGLWNESRHSFGIQLSPFGNIARGSHKLAEPELEVYDRVVPGVWFLGPLSFVELAFKLGMKSLKMAPYVAGTGDLYGMQLGVGFNSARDVSGLQCCGMLQIATGDLTGLQIAWMYNFARDVVGLQASLFGSNIGQDVYGIQITTIGQNEAESLYGLQFGWVNAAGTLGGIQLGMTNSNSGGFGIQLGAFNASSMVGVQVGVWNQGTIHGLGVGVLNFSGDVSGIQVGLINSGARLRGFQVGGYNRMRGGWGMQVGAINRGGSDFSGAQVGVYNGADELSGVQIGVINVADRLSGIQIGLLNIHREGIWILPGINVGYAAWSPAAYACRRARDCS